TEQPGAEDGDSATEPGGDQSESGEPEEGAGTDEAAETSETGADANEAQSEEEAEEEIREEVERATRAAERRAEQEPAAAAGDDAAEDGAEVETRTIEEGDVRSASEEFATRLLGAGSATEAEAPEEDKDRFSTFEKALLLGLGAAAVGAVLTNGDKVVSNSGDRVVVDRDGQLTVLKDDDALLRRPGANVGTETFADGSTRNTVVNTDGSRVVTIRGADGTVLRRSKILASGEEYLLFDDTREIAPITVSELPRADSRRNAFVASPGGSREEQLARALEAELRGDVNRSFSLEQVRSIRQLRELAPEIEVEAITFATGSAAISPDKARELAALGSAIKDLIRREPRTVLLVEGHTDAVGDDAYNLALSDRRAETVALALTQYFDVPPENMITQGYGEHYLKVRTEKAEPANRRALVRNITTLLQ
ncbi:OmpA family protein, partial [Pontibaca methylaminivorans]|uniref:OmpA family protein n=1 Tax=Pontibaca methylaminivorans TaxID=515897 RepID=UPI002FD8F334